VPETEAVVRRRRDGPGQAVEAGAGKGQTPRRKEQEVMTQKMMQNYAPEGAKSDDAKNDAKPRAGRSDLFVVTVLIELVA
jgi:hypothetical protein